MTEAELIAKHIAEHGVTRVAAGQSGIKEEPAVRERPVFHGRRPVKRTQKMLKWSYQPPTHALTK